METFDHIVIGGGSAGSVATARLIKGGAKVLLLEGGYHHRHPLLDMPPGVFKLLKNGSKFFRTHKSTPQSQLGGRQTEIPQGNVLGGGSTVNGQAYVRGRPQDYDAWHAALRGNNDAVHWDWEAVLPHFKRLEGNRKFNDDLHGCDGPLTVSDPGHIDDMARWFVQALQAQGEPFNPDFNGKSQRGAGFFQFTYDRGQRVSAAYAFLDPIKNNPKLTIRLRSAVQRVLIQDGRAVGVVYRDKSGTEHTARCAGEVILSAGALITPKLLMLSGLGPADHLRDHDIDVVQDMPGIGRNLQDHPDVSIVARANGRYGYFKQDRGWNMLRNGMEFKLFGRGRITTTGLEAACFVNPTDPEALPTHEAYCIPVMYLNDAQARTIPEDYGVSIQMVLLKPQSTGDVKLASANPDDMPLVNPNFLSDERDMDEMVQGLRYFRETMNQSPLADRIAEVVAPTDYSDAALRDHCRRVVKTNFHPAGTAKMGADGDPMAVLDARMRVRGVEGLRVCDMSAVPDIPAGNTNAPAMVLGDRCAEMVLGRL